MKKKILVLVVFTLILSGLFDAAYVAAAPPPVAPPPPPGGGGPPCWPPPCIPIDGGIGFLFAAGLALGGRQLIKKGKSKAE